jgi:hypothetical protein
MDKYRAEVQALQASLKAAQEAVVQFNAREAIFGIKPSDYSGVRKLQEALDPFHQFWASAARCAACLLRSQQLA